MMIIKGKQVAGKKNIFAGRIILKRDWQVEKPLQFIVSFVFLLLFSFVCAGQTNVGTEITEVKIEVRKQINFFF